MITLRRAEEDHLPMLLDIQKTAFKRYTNILSPTQIPPLNEDLEEMRSDIRCKSMIAIGTQL